MRLTQAPSQLLLFQNTNTAPPPIYRTDNCGAQLLLGKLLRHKQVNQGDVCERRETEKSLRKLSAKLAKVA